MDTPENIERRISFHQGMIFGAIWSFASVGWIAGIAFIIAWIKSGFPAALLWLGIILLSGALLFAIVLAITLIAEVLNITTKRSRRDALVYFSWAFLYNLTFGGVSLLGALKLVDRYGIKLF